jgi:hypothetical protein
MKAMKDMARHMPGGAAGGMGPGSGMGGMGGMPGFGRGSTATESPKARFKQRKKR